MVVVKSNFYLILYMVEISASEDFLSLMFEGFVCFFSPGASMQFFIVIMSWFVLTVMLEDFLCTRAKRAETNRYVPEFWLQIAISKTFNFWAMGLWEKLGFLWLKELLVHSSDTEFICDAIFYWVISKAGHITVTYYILPNSLGAVVIFCLY